MPSPPNPRPWGVSPDDLAAQGARCAVHPDVTAHAVCLRCGNFMCGDCSRGDRAALCPQCRERGGSSSFPFSRERYSIGGLVSYCWERFKPQWLGLCLSALLFLGVVYGVALVGGLFVGIGGLAKNADSTRVAVGIGALQVSVQALQLVLQIWLQLGLFAVVLDVLEGRDAQVATVFSRLRRLPAVLLQMLLIYLGIAVFAAPAVAAFFLAPGDDGTRLKIAASVGVLMAIPGLYVGLGVSFAILELTYNPAAGAISALRKSFELARDHRVAILGTAIVSFLVSMAGVFACCIGIVPSLALGTMIYCALYLALRTPTVQA